MAILKPTSILTGDNLSVDAPEGGTRKFSGGITGRIKITLPTSWSDTMLSFKVNIYNYMDDSTAGANNLTSELNISGYNYTVTSSWYNTGTSTNAVSTAQLYEVNFGHDGTSCCVYIGNSDSVWRHMSVKVYDFNGSYNNYTIEKWGDGWSVDVTADAMSGVTSTVRPTLLATDVTNDLWGDLFYGVTPFDRSFSTAFGAHGYGGDMLGKTSADKLTIATEVMTRLTAALPVSKFYSGPAMSSDYTTGYTLGGADGVGGTPTSTMSKLVFSTEVGSAITIAHNLVYMTSTTYSKHSDAMVASNGTVITFNTGTAISTTGYGTYSLPTGHQASRGWSDHNNEILYLLSNNYSGGNVNVYQTPASTKVLTTLPSTYAILRFSGGGPSMVNNALVSVGGNTSNRRGLFDFRTHVMVEVSPSLVSTGETFPAAGDRGNYYLGGFDPTISQHPYSEKYTHTTGVFARLPDTSSSRSASSAFGI